MVTQKMLKEAERKMRYFVKRTLHLFFHISNAALHATVRDGGLGVLSFSQLPLSSYIKEQIGVDHILDAAINMSGVCVRRIARIAVPTATTKDAAKNSAALETSFFGNGIAQAGKNV